jgi:ADP-ribosylglycohydrolase
MPLFTACVELAEMPGFPEFAATCPNDWQATDDGEALPSPGSFEDRARAAVVGAFVADAAAMPFHWIYSAAQITRTVGRGNTPEFYATPQCQWYSYRTGDLSPFGQQGLVYLRTLAASTHDTLSFVDPVEIADAYYAYYSGDGPCASSSVCYHDTCTRGFVANIRSGQTWPRCGANDDQDEAITHLIPVVALLAGRPEMLERCVDAVRVIQNTDRAVAFGLAAARILEAILLGALKLTFLTRIRLTVACLDLTPSNLVDGTGATPPDAITATIAVLLDPDRAFASQYDADLAGGLQRAMTMASRGTSPASAGPVFGTACDYPSPLNLGAHMVARLGAPTGTARAAAAAAEPTATEEAAAWMEAVRQNIYQGGDTAGRGQFVGAMMAASEGMSAIPRSWIEQLDPDTSEEITHLVAQLTQQRAALDRAPTNPGQQGH